MTSTIADTTLNAWKSGRKTHSNTKGWITGNACCCIHNGESADKRGRGGVIADGSGGVSYHCFNCNFAVVYEPGYPLSYKFRKLLRWLNVDDSEIFRLSIDATNEQKRQELLGIVKVVQQKEELKVKFKKEELPEESTTFMGLVEFYELAEGVSYPAGFVKAVEYLDKRKINMHNYEFYWSPSLKNQMRKRAIIPFTWKGETIGFTARAIDDDVVPKYIQHVDSGYVFNVDKQQKDWKFVIVCEGVLDAISVDGVAILKSDVSQQQIDLIESLDREIIVVPDFNKSGQRLIDVALNNGWSVAFPVWAETCEDINEAVVKYGKLFVLKAIVDSVERYSLKIKLLRKKYIHGS